MRNLARRLLCVTLTLSLAFPGVSAAQPTYPPSAASLTREQFENFSDTIIRQEFGDLVKQVGNRERTEQAVKAVGQKYGASKHAKVIRFYEISHMAQAWMVFLDLSRQGYPEAAITVLQRQLVQVTIRLERIFFSNPASDFSADDAQELIADLSGWSVEAYQQEAGFLKRHEVDRMFGGIRDAIVAVDAKSVHADVRKYFGLQQTKRWYVESSMNFGGLAGFLGGAIGAGYLFMMLVDQAANQFGVLGFIGSVFGFLGLTATSFFGGFAAPAFAADAYGRWKTKMRSHKKLAERCQAMLTPSGEIIP